MGIAMDLLRLGLVGAFAPVRLIRCGGGDRRASSAESVRAYLFVCSNVFFFYFPAYQIIVLFYALFGRAYWTSLF